MTRNEGGHFMTWIIMALCITLLVLQYQIWFAPDGWLHIRHINSLIVTQQHINQGLQYENKTLQTNITNLKKYRWAIEEHARRDMGMIQQGETYYQIVRPS